MSEAIKNLAEHLEVAEKTETLRDSTEKMWKAIASQGNPFSVPTVSTQFVAACLCCLTELRMTVPEELMREFDAAVKNAQTNLHIPIHTSMAALAKQIQRE